MLSHIERLNKSPITLVAAACSIAIAFATILACAPFCLAADNTDSQLKWHSLYEEAIKAYHYRIYDLAERELEQAETIARNLPNSEKLLLQCRIAQANIDFATAKPVQAKRSLEKYLPQAEKLFGRNSQEAADILYTLARCNFSPADYTQVESLCRRALAIAEKANSNSLETGQTKLLLGLVLARQGLNNQADPLLNQALSILEKNPGPQELDLADGLRAVALVESNRRNVDNAQSLFARSLAIKEKAIRFSEPSCLRGLVTIPFDGGFVTGQEIAEGPHALRASTVAGLKVAACLVDLKNIVGVLVSLTNTTTKPLPIGIGPVNLLITKPSVRQMPELDRRILDVVLEENTFWDQTWRQPTLAAMQTTYQPLPPAHGYDPNLHQDNRVNIFGPYGKWDLGKKLIPTEVEIEQVGESVLDADNGEKHKAFCNNLNATILEPNGSRAGIVFFQYQPWSQVVVNVSIGNAMFQLPFVYTGKL
jgi:tetratricopeptide (TPR) repeat protein